MPRSCSGAQAPVVKGSDLCVNVSSLLLLFVLSLGLAEAALRVYQRIEEWHTLQALPPVGKRAIIPSTDPELIFEWNPGWGSGAFTVNSFGMPNDEITLEKPADVFRIAFLGDSISANLASRPRAEIYLNVLARTLNQEKRGGWRFEALNFGVNGYGILQELRTLRTRVLPFHPDLVVIQHCLNDPYPSDMEGAAFAPIGRSRLWKFVFRHLQPERFRGWYVVERNYDSVGLENLRRGMVGLGDEVQRGVRVVAVLFPYLYEPAYDSWGYQRYHEPYRQGAAQARIPLVDLYTVFREAGFISNRPVDVLHPPAEAHTVAAAVIEVRLDELGLLPARHPGA